MGSEKSTSIAPPSLAQRSSGCPNINPLGGSTPGTVYYNGQPGGCPIINALDADKSCTSSMTPLGTYCSGYCELSTEFFYGKEVPFSPAAHCSADQSCSVQASDSATITQTYTFNVGASLQQRSEEMSSLVQRDAASTLKAAFDVGASYSYSTAKTTLSGITLSRPMNNNASDCGYWTMVPIFWTSCGTMSTALVNFDAVHLEKDHQGKCPKTKVATTQNYCNTTPYLDSSGRNAGIPIFVVTGCKSNLLQPAHMQDPIYTFPGVAATAFSTTVQQ
ncbi:hypothetical protein LPUS_02235 [Lasallia pustulata]|uniref:Uncharacterized protein n=1 Tax=Lasallia pustulata TaxID=136370 RepID=A0A1W5CS69_9LECA|nr:hypothetical protein LPUS_02235 [Lasallia pustulata]